MSAPATESEVSSISAMPTPTKFIGHKRPHSSDMTEFTDKKAYVIVRREPDSGRKTSPDPGSGILARMANRFSTPFPYAVTQTVVVRTSDMNSYFSSLWNALVTALYPDCSFESAGLITEADFVLVCRYLTKARIDHVFASSSGLRLSGHIGIPGEYQIPKSLADVINGIGTIVINSGAFMVIPKPEPAPEDRTCALNALVSHVMLSSFASLVKSAHVRGFISIANVSSGVEGTAWWLLTARDSTDVKVIANNLDRVVVAATFPEWKPVDGLLCAIVQRKFDGLFPDLLTGLTWAFDTVCGIHGLRYTFNLDA